MTTIILLSGHGENVKSNAKGTANFDLPKDFEAYFYTRDGVVIPDSQAGKIESNPPTTKEGLNKSGYYNHFSGKCPDLWLIDPNIDPNKPLNIQAPNVANPSANIIQIIPAASVKYKLSEIVSRLEAEKNNPNSTLNLSPKIYILWCACRAENPADAWKKAKPMDVRGDNMRELVKA